MMINEKVSKFLIYHKGIAVTESLCMYIYIWLEGYDEACGLHYFRIFLKDVMCWPTRCSVCFVQYTTTRPKGYTNRFLKSRNPTNVLKSTKIEIAKHNVMYV